MAPLYGWGSTAWKLEPLQGDGLLFTTKFPEFLILILSTLEWWMTESTLEPPSDFEQETPRLGIQCLNHYVIALWKTKLWHRCFLVNI